MNRSHPPGQGQSKKALRRRARRAGTVAAKPKKQKSRGSLQALAAMGPYRPAAYRPVQGLTSNRSVAQPLTRAGVITGGSRASSQTRVCARRELIQSVTGTSAFTVGIQLPINAALASLFLWLSKEARLYEKYRFRRLAFEYENSVGPADSTNAGGNVIMMVDFDVLDAAPATLQAMMQNEVVALFSPYEKVRLNVPQQDLARAGWLYTRLGGVPSGADAKTYDMGQFEVATNGCSANGLGNVFVDYEVELMEPQDAPSLAQKWAGATSLTASALVGSDAANVAGSVPAFALTNSSTLTCLISGDYLITIAVVGTVIVESSAAWSGTATITAIQRLGNTAATNAVTACVVRAQVGQTVVPAIDSATTVTAVTGRIAPYNYALL